VQTGKVVKQAVQQGILEALESGKVGVKRIDRAVTNLVNRGLAGDYGRSAMIGNILGSS